MYTQVTLPLRINTYIYTCEYTIYIYSTNRVGGFPSYFSFCCCGGGGGGIGGGMMRFSLSFASLSSRFHFVSFRFIPIFHQILLESTFILLTIQSLLLFINNAIVSFYSYLSLFFRTLLLCVE